jgi:hypothetical protein
MTIETATYISQLNTAYPASGDAKSEGDNHIRLLKSTIKATWPNLTATPVTPTSADLNTVAGAATTGGVGLNVATQTAANNTTLAASTAFVSTAVAAAAFAVTLPSQSGNAGRNIYTDGSTASWQSVGGPITLITGTTQTAVSGPQYVATNVAATTVTLPASPTTGDVIWFTVGNGLITNTIDPGANTINGTAGTMTVDDQYATIFVKWDGVTWILVPLGGFMPSFTNPVINGGSIGATTPGSGAFTTLSSTGNGTFGDAEATDTHTIKGATTLLANSASAALTVTQTGAGNAFVVEDVASPDSSAFIVDGNGNTVVGYTATFLGLYAGTNKFGVTGTGGVGQSYFANSAVGVRYDFLKSRNATVGSHTVVQSGDDLGGTFWGGSDGTNFIPAASITAVVDGTPGANDMPGRLVFSTTRDGASSPTEAMRIDSSQSIYNNSTGTGTNSYGFNVSSALTGATNNYGFYSNIAAAANRYNFYAAGTAQNYFAGVTGIGVVPASTSNLAVAASTTAVSSLNIPHGAAPSSPVNGDMWSTTAGLFIRINGVTKTVTLT